MHYTITDPHRIIFMFRGGERIREKGRDESREKEWDEVRDQGRERVRVIEKKVREEISEEGRVHIW